MFKAVAASTSSFMIFFSLAACFIHVLENIRDPKIGISTHDWKSKGITNLLHFCFQQREIIGISIVGNQTNWRRKTGEETVKQDYCILVKSSLFTDVIIVQTCNTGHLWNYSSH